MNNIKDKTKKNNLSLTENETVFVFSKLEKIITAIYFITDIFPKDEPLRFSLRKKCLELMSFIMSFKRGGSRKDDRVILYLVLEIRSLLKISALANLISEMNYKILISEYDKFSKLLKSRDLDGFALEKDFFKDLPSGDLSKGHINEKEKVSDRNVLKKNIKDTSNKVTVNKGLKKKSKMKRRESILNFIKDNKNISGEFTGVSVKDIKKVIKDCGEKTIQRELTYLLNEGVLKKEGERRWSRYLLA